MQKIKTEKDIKKYLQSLHFAPLKHFTPGFSCEFVSIETGATTSGIPDIYYYVVSDASMYNNVTGWIELKIGKQLANKNVVVNFRPGQIPFLESHSVNNKRTFTLVYIDGLFYLITKVFKNVYSDVEFFENAVFIGSSLNSKPFFDILLTGEKS